MPDTKIASAESSDYSNQISNVTIPAVQTDGATDNNESEWICSEGTQYLGYYKADAMLQSSIDAKARWTVGKGTMADPDTTFILDGIRGFGKDTFNSILENAVRTYTIYGDAYIEIIRDEKKKIINLKTLDPSTIKIIAKKGVIKRYEQINKIKGKVVQTFQPLDLIHLCRNRVADEIHGISLIPSVEQIILAKNEAMVDYKTLLHRNIYPVRIWHLDTDVPAEIAAFKQKIANSKGKFEDIFIPKGCVETEIAAVPANATMNPMPWINYLNQMFYQATGVPQIIVGGSGEMTEATAKICYLAFEQTIEEEQLYIEEQIGMQLGLKIELEFPATLQNEVLSDTGKEETMQAATPEDTSAPPAEMTQGVAQ